MKKTWAANTICQTLRECYALTDNPEIKMKLRVAVSMAKSMNRKLQEYKPGWDKGFWDVKDEFGGVAKP